MATKSRANSKDETTSLNNNNNLSGSTGTSSSNLSGGGVVNGVMFQTGGTLPSALNSTQGNRSTRTSFRNDHVAFKFSADVSQRINSEDSQTATVLKAGNGDVPFVTGVPAAPIKSKKSRSTTNRLLARLSGLKLNHNDGAQIDLDSSETSKGITAFISKLLSRDKSSSSSHMNTVGGSGNPHNIHVPLIRDMYAIIRATNNQDTSTEGGGGGGDEDEDSVNVLDARLKDAGTARIIIAISEAAGVIVEHSDEHGTTSGASFYTKLFPFLRSSISRTKTTTNPNNNNNNIGAGAGGASQDSSAGSPRHLDAKLMSTFSSDDGDTKSVSTELTNPIFLKPPFPSGLKFHPDSKTFSGTKQPKIPLDRYIARLVRYLNTYHEQTPSMNSVGCRSLIAATIFIDRMRYRHPKFPMNSMNVHRLFAISVLVAAKVLEDDHPSNEYMASVSGLDLEELNNLEISFLVALDFDCELKYEDVLDYYVKFDSRLGELDKPTGEGPI